MAFTKQDNPFVARMKAARAAKGGSSGGEGALDGFVSSSKGFLGDLERRVSKLSTLEFALVAVGGVLLVDHLIAPKGMSYASKALAKVGVHPALPALPPPPVIPPPGVTASIAAKGEYAGANAQAGWNRGMSPYGGWALNAPAGPWHYAHANSPHRGGYDWAY
jgi:hypothetical protein